MEDNSTTVIDREALLNVVRKTVEAKGGKRVSLREFLDSTGMTHAMVFNLFARWQDVLRAAGFNLLPRNSLTPQNLLLEDWGKVARSLKKLPSKSEYRIMGNFCGATLENHFGSWLAAQDAFLAFSVDKPEWNDVRALILPLEGGGAGRFPGRLCQKRVRPWKSRRLRGTRHPGSGPVYGPLLDFGALRHAPVNESGVILLFGMVAERLGFIVDAVRPNYPDCEAIKKTGADRWERVRIEFEYESRNFRDHKHDPEGCDLIICWAHNWPECPVEVLDLRDKIGRLGSDVHAG